MVLLLVTHIVEVPSSRVPLAVIILNDAVKRKALPVNLKCRMVIPSSGNYSASLWDASSVEDLRQWIDANLMDGVVHIDEVPEEFTYGVALELTTARAADKVAISSKNTLERINNTGARVVESVVEKLDRLDQRTHLITATREATSAAVGRVRQATDRALESEGVQKSLASISSGLQTASKGVGRAFSWVGSKVKETFPSAQLHGASYTTFASDNTTISAPPGYESIYSESAVYAMPVSTNAARPSGDDTGALGVGGGTAWGTAAGAPLPEEAVPPPMPQFTLEDATGSPNDLPVEPVISNPDAARETTPLLLGGAPLIVAKEHPVSVSKGHPVTVSKGEESSSSAH